MTTESGEPTAGDGDLRPSAAVVPGPQATPGDDRVPEGAEPASRARHRAPEPADEEEPPDRDEVVVPGDGAPDPDVAYGTHAADPEDDGAWADGLGETRSAAGRRNAVILRYLLGRLAIDHVRRLTVWTPVVPVAGAVLLLVHPRWIGGAVLVVGLVLVAARIAMVRALRRRSLPDRYRPVETALRDAVEAGKANLRVELRRAGLPSRSWQLPLYALRLARGTGRTQARAKMRDVDVDLVLPRAQLDRAVRVLDQAGG